MPIYRLTLRGTSPTELILYLPLTGDPHQEGARFDDDVDGPHLCCAIVADGGLWRGEALVDVDDDGRIAAEVTWDGCEYPTDISDLFSAPLRIGRTFKSRDFNRFGDTWDLRVERVE